MIIRNDKEYKDYEARVEKLIERGTELGDMELQSLEEKAEFAVQVIKRWKRYRENLAEILRNLFYLTLCLFTKMR